MDFLSKLFKQPIQVVKNRYYTYTGTVRDGDLNGTLLTITGKGLLYDHTTDYVYDGELKNGQYHGLGQLTYSPFSNYNGQWHHGLQHGHGRLVHKDGWIYEGQWFGGLMHRQGKFEFVDHTIYEGSFVNGNIEGHGIEYVKGDCLTKRYQGSWLNGLYNGEGVYYYANGKPWYSGS